MKVTVMTSLLAKRDMDVDATHKLVFSVQIFSDQSWKSGQFSVFLVVSA